MSEKPSSKMEVQRLIAEIEKRKDNLNRLHGMLGRSHCEEEKLSS